jgi:fatty-acyl-CoA synthase
MVDCSIATAKIGAILVNINPSYRTYELEYALNHSGCKSIVIADKKQVCGLQSNAL